MLSKKNNLESLLLRETLVEVNTTIRPMFGFSKIEKSEQPYEHLISLVLNKIYSLNVSMENNVLCNDVHQSVSLYRYFYELYLKMFSIFSEPLERERLDNFYLNKNLTFRDWLESIDENILPPNLKPGHKDHYLRMSRMVHPNLESLGLHQGNTDDQIFEFVASNIKMALWFEISILKMFSIRSETDSFRNLNTDKLNLLFGQLSD